MADRFFPNEMPDFVAEDEASSASGSGGPKDSLTKLLHLPYKTLSHKLQKSALDLKQMVSTPQHTTPHNWFMGLFWFMGFCYFGFLGMPTKSDKTFAFHVNYGFMVL